MSLIKRDGLFAASDPEATAAAAEDGSEVRSGSPFILDGPPSIAMPPRKKAGADAKAATASSKGKKAASPSAAKSSKAKSSKKTAADPLEAATARWIVPDTPTLSLALSYTSGLAVRRLFFHSREWVAPLRADVAALVALFEEQYTAKESPLELMKRLWIETGWKWVLLLGCPEGQVRVDWLNSLVRAFLEHLVPTEATPPLQTVAAFLALYLLRASCCDGMQLMHIPLSPTALPLVLQLPTRLATAVDLNRSDKAGQIEPPPSADLVFVLHYFLSTKAFHLVPEQTFLHPPPDKWPFARLKHARRAERDARLQAAVLLGIEDELEEVSRGVVRPEVIENEDLDLRSRKRRRSESYGFGLDTEEQPDEADPAFASDPWKVEALQHARARYLDAKTLNEGGSAFATPSLLSKPMYDIQASIIAHASLQTRQALGSLGDQASDLAAFAEAGGTNAQGLLALLGTS